MATWLAPLGFTDAPQQLIDVVEEYLQEKGVIDLSHWVMEDLPSGKAHFIDDTTDSLWTLVLLLAARAPADERSSFRLRIDRGLYSTRERLFSVIKELEKRAEQVSKDLALPDFSIRLTRVSETLRASVKDYERSEAESIARAPIDTRLVVRLRAAAANAWRSGSPRSWLDKAAAIKAIPAKGPDRFRLHWGARAPRIFFIERLDVAGDSPEFIGQELGRAFTDAEASRVVQLLEAVPAWKRSGRLEQRLETAVLSLARIGGATHAILPHSWEHQAAIDLIRRQLEQAPMDVEIVELPGWEDPSVVLCGMPRGIVFSQYLGTAPTGLKIDVEPTESLEGEDPSPKVVVRADEWVRIAVVARYIRRIPFDLSDR